MLMAAITPTEAQAYFKRWELVKEIELVELRRTSMDVKLSQLSALMASHCLVDRVPAKTCRTSKACWLRIPRPTSPSFGSGSANSLPQ